MKVKKTLFKTKNKCYTDLLQECKTWQEVMELEDKSTKLWNEKVVHADSSWLSSFSNEQKLWVQEEHSSMYETLLESIEQILTDDELSVFYMTHEGQHSLRAVANKMNKSHEWVRKTLLNAKTKLKEELPEEYHSFWVLLTNSIIY